MNSLKHIQELRSTQHKHLVEGKITEEDYITRVRRLDKSY